MATVLKARQLLTPIERIDDAVLLIDEGTILSVGSRDAVAIPPKARIVDFGEAILVPGFIDIHLHGAAGHDVMEGSEEGLAAIEQLLLRHGVTSYCPTTITAPIDQTIRSLDRITKASARRREERGVPRARALGIHLEGPFLSHARRGVHSPIHLQLPSTKLFDQMWEAAGGEIGMLTIAPELEGALDLIAAASARGVCVSIGHSNADLAQAMAGIQAGARHATHTFNAMRRLDHRDPGVLGAVLTDDTMTADIIADGIHLQPSVVDLFVRAKGAERAVLISDSVSATGMPDGTYRLGSFEVEVRNGRCESYGKLAGSILTLDAAIRNVISFAGTSLQQAVRMATLNPARVLGVEKRKGKLQAGADADIVVLTPAGQVRQAIVGGGFA